MNKIIIAIDGPAASGKSSVAKIVAKNLNYLYIDSGAMYRAVALYMLEHGSIANLNDIKITFDENRRVYLNGKDVTEEIRSNEVTKLVPKIAQNPKVREYLVKLQQEFGKKHNIVMDGRDIGSVVFKNADVKIYQIASVDARAQRRYLEEKNKESNITLEMIKKDIMGRDEADINREVSPLIKADDAIEVDTSHLSLEESADLILNVIKERVMPSE